MRDSGWNGVSGVPGIGASIKINEDAQIFWGEEQSSKSSFKNKLFKLFKSRKSKIKQAENKINHGSPFTFPKLKVVKEEHVERNKSQNRVKISAYWPRTPILKNDVKRNKSMPLPKSTYSPQSYAQPKLTKSVATQTDHSGFGHRKLSRMKTPDITQLEKRRLSQKVSVGLANKNKYSLDISETSSDYSEHNLDNTCNLEVFQTITIGESDLINSYFNKSDITSPTFIMETEEDTDTDTNSDVDDNNDDDASLNIYEEVLNHDGFEHRYQKERFSWNEPSGHQTTFHQNSCYLPTNHKIVEKKKLSRMTKSNPPHPGILELGQKNEVLQSPKDKESETKVKGLKKTLSDKMSRFRSNQLYTFDK